MCGLVGIAGALSQQDEDPMRKMMMMNWFRGKDSTGFASVKGSGETNIAKIDSGPLHLFESIKFRAALNGNTSCVFMGHARAATRGEVNTFNAHPFEFDHIIGAHNGTLFPASQDELEKELGEKFPVDSMTIIAAIAALGVEEAYKHMRGSWAVQWVNLEEGTLNFLRNDERPLWYATSEDNRFIWWASDWTHMGAGIGQMGANPEYRTTKRGEDGGRFFPFPTDTLVTVDLSKLVKGVPQKFVTKKLEGKKPFLASSGRSDTGDPNRASDPFRRKQNLTTTSLSSKKTDEVIDRALLSTEIGGTKEEPYGGLISEVAFNIMTGEGCSFCNSPIKWGDKGITLYLRDGIALCKHHSSVSDPNKTRIFVDDILQNVVNSAAVAA